MGTIFFLQNNNQNTMSSFFGRMMFGLGRGVRETGQALDRVGCKIQGNLAFVEELSRHRRLAPLYDKWPSVGKKVFIAPNASVIGDVQIRDGASVWYGAVLRSERWRMGAKRFYFV